MTDTAIAPKQNPVIAIGRRSEMIYLSVILCLGLLLRLWLLRFDGYQIDVTLFTDWTNALQKIPLDEYYGLVAPWCDYLPGYLYVLGATGWLKGLVSGPGTISVQDFEPWIKAGPIVADLVLAIAAYAIARRFASPRRAILATSLVAVNPAIMFVGAVWGQVESVATALYMLAFLALVSGSPVVAAVWAGVAFATKPQYAIFLAPVGVAYLNWVVFGPHGPGSSDGRKELAVRIVRKVLLPVAMLTGTVQLLLVPFSTSLWPMPAIDWTFYERVSIAEIGRFTSAGAFNFWGTQVAGIRQPDWKLGWFSMTYETWGYLLFAAVAVIALVVAWRNSNDPEAVLWACFLIAFGFFEILTRMHERYLFAAIPLLAVLAAFSSWAVLFCAALSSLYFVNLWYMWVHGPDLFANQTLIRWASDFSVLLFLAALVTIAVKERAAQRRDNPSGGLWDALSISKGGGRSRPSILSRILDRRATLAAPTLLAIVALTLAVGVAAGKYLEARAVQAGSPFKTATVRAFRSNWQDTGVSLKAGDRVTIIASGRWDHKHEGDLYGPGGNGKIESWNLLPSAPTGILLGRIGGSTPFVVGDGTTFTAKSSGPLRLVMNADRDNYVENRGRVQVVVAVNP